MSTTHGREQTHLEVGVIARPHGVRGELKAHLHNRASDALSHTEVVLLELSGARMRTMTLESVRGMTGEPVLRFAGVVTREEADSLRGARIWVERARLPSLPAGEYYLVDLIGCEVRVGGTVIGRAVAVRPDPTVDTLVIERPDGTQVEQPILDPWIGAYDSQGRSLELTSDDGLIS